MGLLFSGITLDECLKKASDELKIPQESLRYKIVEQKHIFFKKHVKIEVSQYDTVTKENSDMLKTKVEEQTKDNKNYIIDKKSEKGIKVENGKIIIVDPNYLDTNCVKIQPCNGINLLIDGKECTSHIVLHSNEKIEIEDIKRNATRKVDLSISEDKMEAYITIIYTPEYYHELIDKPCCDNLVLEVREVEGKYPPKYTCDEILTILKENKIVYGIMKDNLNDICKSENSVERILVAKGDQIIEDIPDNIQVFFETTKKRILTDENERVDYRNMYSISNVKVDDILAEKVEGKDGKDGTDIFGKKVNRIRAKKIVLKTGEGCTLKGNKVIALIEGRPSCKSGVYSVNKVYTINDVDMKSGNINFIGDVEITGSIKYGTEVKCGNSVTVKKNVEEAKISAGGQITVEANALNSKITSGSEDINKKKHLEILKQYETIIEELIIAVKQIKDKRLLGDNKSDGEIIKILIENKFKNIPRLSMLIISFELSDGITESTMLTFIREKIIGLGPINIKNYFELYELKKMVLTKIDTLSEEITIPTDIYVSYVQDSTIEASGNVFITGKGQYVSKITALNNIEFTQSGSVCRGGVLCAGNEVKLKTVGSIAGVLTRIEVPRKGIITADIAYQNTVFCFGEKQIILDVASRDVKAYLGKDGMVNVDKFLL